MSPWRIWDYLQRGGEWRDGSWPMETILCGRIIPRMWRGACMTSRTRFILWTVRHSLQEIPTTKRRRSMHYSIGIPDFSWVARSEVVGHLSTAPYFSL